VVFKLVVELTEALDTNSKAVEGLLTRGDGIARHEMRLDR
jgi:hypothetical protein